MPELSSYPPVTSLTGPERIPIVTNPGVAGGNAYITAANMAADMATDTAFTSGFIAQTATQAGTPAAPTSTSIWRFNPPATDTHGPFQMLVGGANFVSTFDRVMYLGYNTADGGGRVVSAEPSFGMVVESDYDDSVKHNIEAYFEYQKASGASGPTQFRPIFMQIDRATGALSLQLNATTGFSMATTDGAQTQWGLLRPSGLTLTPLTGQSCSLVLGWVTGGQNAIQVGNSTNGFLLQPISSGNATWEMRVGSAQAFAFAPTTGITLGGASAIFLALNGGGFSIRNAADSATLPLLRNISNELYIGGSSTWTGVSFQAGGATPLRIQTAALTLTEAVNFVLGTTTGTKFGTGATQKLAFYGATPVAQQTGVAVTAGGVHAALVALGLITA